MNTHFTGGAPLSHTTKLARCRHAVIQRRMGEFRADAVRIAPTSGLTRKQVVSDLGVGLSMLNKWVTVYRDTDVVSDQDLNLAFENERHSAPNIDRRKLRNFVSMNCSRLPPSS